jgi:hypothetical protein
MIRGASENKMLAGPVETKATRYRVPTGDVDARVFARVLDGETHGAVPVLDLRTFRRSPSEPSDKDDAFHPTGAGVTLELRFVPSLLEAIAKAAGLEVTVTEARVAA